MNADHRAEAPASSRSGIGRGLVALGLALAPALLAIATTPGFTTQDGPAHIYSARILNASLAARSPFAATFRVTWDPLPNWVGHLATMLAVAVWPAEVANRVIAAVTLAAFALAILSLRWVVAGARGIATAAILAGLLSLNVTWLLGFTSFLLGASVAPITLAVWWSGRDGLGVGRTLVLMALLVLGYFCHPISLGLTVVGLATLVITTPGPNRWTRALATCLSGGPLIPLGLTYRALTRSGGKLEPVWDHWTSWSVAGVVSQLGWVDPLSLAAKSTTPFDLWPAVVPPALLAPAVWTLVGVVLLVAATWARRSSDRLGWIVLAAGLVGAGLVAPDTLGVKHGHFLPQRVVLLGLVALVPWLDLGWDRLATRVAAVALGGALAVQSVFVWDYAATCRDRVSPFLRATTAFEATDRAGTLLNSIRGRFRANPLLHADGLIGAATDSVFWTNYETAQYYFPVKVRPDVEHPVATAFEQVAILDNPRDAHRRAVLWTELLETHGAVLDKIVEWRSDPALDETIQRHYRIIHQDESLRVWSRRARPPG